MDNVQQVSQEPEGLIGCDEQGCRARFFFVAVRQYPTLCLDHADDADRMANGWTVANSID